MKRQSEQELAREILYSLYPLDLSIVGKGNDEFVRKLADYMDFEVMEFPSGSSLLGWTIPESWELKHFSLFADQVLVPLNYESPFIVSKNSKSLEVELTWEELQRHICVPELWQSDALPYDWRNLYRDSKQQDWAISVTREEFESFDKSATYKVIIESEFSPGTMKVLMANSSSIEVSQNILVNAHNCHPFQANDDISGVVALVLLHLRMREKASSINVASLVAPELFGPLYFLNSLRNQTKEVLYNGAILFKAVGNDGPLKLQQSLNESSTFNRASRKVFCDLLSTPERIFPFRELYGNDEIVLECPPFRIPTITLTRFPFPEYHNADDRPEKIDISRIIESVDVAEEMITAFGSNMVYRWEREGLPKLNTVSHNLYKPASMPGLSGKLSTLETETTFKSWNTLMNSLPSLINQGMDTLMISERFNLKYDDVLKYLNQWVEAGHIKPQQESR